MNYSQEVYQKISKYPVLEVIDAQRVYRRRFNNMSEQAFYQALSRMEKKGELARISKGIYCRPKEGRFQKIVSSDDQIVDYYLGKNHKSGVVIGYRLYNKYGITTQIAKNLQVYSNLIEEEKKNIRSVEVKRLNVKFDEQMVDMIELIEVCKNLKAIEDINRGKVIDFFETSIKKYDDESMNKVIRATRYKKSTIASLRNILNYFKIEHTLDQHLRGTSKYKTFKMEDLYEVA